MTTTTRSLSSVLALLTLVEPAAFAAVLAGDCDGNGRVTVNEVITCVDIDLGTATLDACPAYQCPSAVKVEIPCLLIVVNNLLYPPTVAEQCGVGCYSDPSRCPDTCTEVLDCGSDRPGTDLCDDSPEQFAFCLAQLCPGAVLP